MTVIITNDLNIISENCDCIAEHILNIIHANQNQYFTFFVNPIPAEQLVGVVENVFVIL